MAQIMQDKYILGQSASGDLETNGEEIRLDLSLQPNTNDITGGNISGTVTGTGNTGTPIPNAYIKLMTTKYAPVIHAITDANGKYSLVNIPAGNYTIFAIAKGMELNQGNEVTVTNYQDYTVDFTLSPDPSSQLAIIVGDLTNTTTHDVINGAVVSLFLNGPNSTQILKTITYSNQYGQYAFREVPIGNYTITISALGYETLSTTADVTTAGQIISLNKALTSSVNGTDNGTVSGIITDNTGKPINEADVILYKVTTATPATTISLDNNNENILASTPSTTLTPVAFTKTNTNGVYLFIGVPKGTYKVKSNELETVTVNPPTKLVYTPDFISFAVQTSKNKENSKVFSKIFNIDNVSLESPAIIKDEVITGISHNNGSVSFKVDVPISEEYELTIKYVSNNSDTLANISVNEKTLEKTYSFTKTKSMSVKDFNTKVIPVFLNKGINIIRIFNE